VEPFLEIRSPPTDLNYFPGRQPYQECVIIPEEMESNLEEMELNFEKLSLQIFPEAQQLWPQASFPEAMSRLGCAGRGGLQERWSWDGAGGWYPENHTGGV
jgi:hypothetical protein